MERIKIDAYSAVASGIAGLLIGAGTGWLVCRRHFAGRFDERLDAEVAALKEHYSDRDVLRAAVEALGYVSGGDTAEPVEPADPVLDPEQWVEEQLSSVVREELDRVEGDEPGDQDGEDPHDGVELSPGDVELADSEPEAIDPLIKDRDTSKPYVISFEEFVDPPEGQNQVTLRFYAVDGTLCDEDDQPIPAYKKLVGTLSALDFGGISKDPHIRYVRNDQREQDFEIILNAGSYADAILNYADKQKKPG